MFVRQRWLGAGSGFQLPRKGLFRFYVHVWKIEEDCTWFGFPRRGRTLCPSEHRLALMRSLGRAWPAVLFSVFLLLLLRLGLGARAFFEGAPKAMPVRPPAVRGGGIALRRPSPCDPTVLFQKATSARYSSLRLLRRDTLSSCRLCPTSSRSLSRGALGCCGDSVTFSRKHPTTTHCVESLLAPRDFLATPSPLRRGLCSAARSGEATASAAFPTLSFSERERALQDTPSERTRNFSIVAHVDHGKSSLADCLLKLAGVIDSSAKPLFLDSLGARA